MGGVAACCRRTLGGPGSENHGPRSPTRPTPGRLTALAAGGIRQQFSTPENIPTSLYGYQLLRGESSETLAVDDERLSIGLTPRPYLRLADASALPASSATSTCRAGSAPRRPCLEPVGRAARYPLDELRRHRRVDHRRSLRPGHPRSVHPCSRPSAAEEAHRSVCAILRWRGHRVGLDDERRIRSLRLSGGGVRPAAPAVNAAGPPPRARWRRWRASSCRSRRSQVFCYAFRAAERGRSIRCPIVPLRPGAGAAVQPEGDLYVCAVPGGARPDARRRL